MRTSLKTASKKPIFDITPFTMLDYPDHLACVIWFAGCNMRCPYCYNPHIVLGEGTIDENDLLLFLNSRIGRLEGVVLSGGECTLYPDIENLCAQIKDLGFKIKIDTNGSNPNVLRSLLERKLVDFISLDFKATKQLFPKITLSSFYDKALLSLRVLIRQNAAFEARTTVRTDMLGKEDIEEIADVLHNEGYKGVYWIQNYLHTENSLGLLDAPKQTFDTSVSSDKIKIAFRNF